MRTGVFACLAAWALVLASVAGRPLNEAPKPRPAALPAPPQVVQTVGSATQGAAPTASPEAVVKQYCIACHNSRAMTGGLTLEGVPLSDIPAHGEVWEKVIRKVRAGMMPPAGMPRPDAATLTSFVTHLESTLDRAVLASPTLRPSMMHRLNRAEYGNAIRDLFGIQVDVSSLLPPDEEAFGFDNNASVLNVTTTLMDRYLSAAWKISAVAVASPAITPTFETFRVRGDLSQHDHVPGLPVGTRGGILIRHYFPVDGEYAISPRLYRETVNIIRGLELEHDLEMTLDGERVVLARFGGPKDEQANYLQPTLAGDEMEKRFQKRLRIPAGLHEIGVAFIKKSSATTLELLQPFERERIDPITPVGIPELDKVTVEGPFDAVHSASSPSRRRVFSCVPASPAEETACARTILATQARRAYRGPVSRTELSRLVDFYDRERSRGGTFDQGIESALRFILVNPNFLFRIEQDPASAAAGAPYRVSDVELASRLSFFLWSSIPDDELLDVAVAGQLREPAELERQVRRMLRDERARALGSNFAGQWLFLRNLRGLTPDADVFPDFDHNLREALQRETELLFESVVLEDRGILTLLDADYTFVNDRLARHYDIPNIYGTQFRRIAVADDARRGLLGHGSVLALTSQNNRTSPVLRGKYVLTNILGTPPPEPPANVPPLDETPGKARSMRDRMEEHRRNPACAGCHKLMDPIGLAMENFDGIGRWRTTDNGAPIDASAELSDGTTVEGPAALRRALLRRSDLFARNVTEMLLSYALGQRVEAYDMPHIRAILDEAAAGNYRFSSLVLGIVKSPPFQMRRAES